MTKPDIEAIRQSPRQHCTVEDVEALADYAMWLESENDELEAEIKRKMSAASFVLQQRDDLNRLCEFNEKTMADLLEQRDRLLAALERADDILSTEYDHVSPWVKATIARVKGAQ